MLDRLPIEIFRDIIKISLNAYGSNFATFDSNRIGLRPPIKKSHVSRSWRTALLSDPTLWAYLNIPQMKPDQIEEFLHRSGSAPLNVLLSFTSTEPSLTVQWCRDGNLPTTLVSIFKEMHRIQVLQCLIVDNRSRSIKNVLHQVLGYLKQPAPMLQSLYLAMEGWTENKEALQILFLGDTPHLKHLHYQVTLDFRELSFSPLLQNLSSLHLDLQPVALINRDILLDVLELSPCLRVFELVIPRHPEFVSHMLYPDGQVHLPCLEKLILWGSCMTDVANFLLDYLVFPFERVRYFIGWCPDFQRRISNSAPLLEFLDQRHHTSLSVFAISKRSMHLELSETYPDETERSVFTTAYDRGYEPINDFPMFLQTFNLSDIVHLNLKGAPLKPTVIGNIFILLENLKHLVVKHGHWADATEPNPSPLTSFLLALMPQQSNFQAQIADLADQKTDIADESDSKQDISKLDRNPESFIFPCPSLSTLSIKFLRPRKVMLDEPYAQAIAACCSVRRQAGHPFKSISIYRSPESATQEAETMLLHNEDCPIDIVTIEDLKISHW